jgi:GcrA cell cycle regulator
MLCPRCNAVTTAPCHREECPLGDHSISTSPEDDTSGTGEGPLPGPLGNCPAAVTNEGLEYPSSPGSASPQAQGEGPPDRVCHTTSDPAATGMKERARCPCCNAVPPWTPEKTARLLELRAKTLSSGRIAAEMGTTRNAVIGKLNRMGFRLLSQKHTRPETRRPDPKRAGRGDDKRRKKTVPKADHPWRPSGSAWGGRSRRIQAELAAAAAPTMVEPDTSTACTLLELPPGTCRWPLGEMLDPPRLFCGDDAVEGASYCQFHRQKAHQ